MSKSSLSRLALLIAALMLPASVRAQSAPAASPFELMRSHDGEPVWAPLLRLRVADSLYAADSPQRGMWLQLLAQVEGTWGNHDRALATWDQLARPSTGDVAAAQRLFGQARGVSALDTLRTMADTARIIMVNERHHAATDRLLTLELLPVLWQKGFRYFAAEAFGYDSVLAMRGYAIDDNSYTSEPVFAEVVREALRLGYTLVPYEAHGEQYQKPDSLNAQQRRDHAQAENLYAATFARDPNAKVLVHAGYEHIRERVAPRWSPMAAYLRARTGIDPVTVDQTAMTERSSAEYGHLVQRALVGALPSRATVMIGDSARGSIGAEPMLVDLVVVRGPSAVVDGRPSYMAMGGRRTPTPIAVPECATQHCFVVAHRA
ncbi:MAG TPA: hypothetical protein VGE27_13980, partial [Gemmatimonas sp.]|uniref:hypothetical protein n=1 Tax=Gemmatimonas sp. TaxID=1962908 RepID=UPI002ED88BBC